MVRRIPSAKMPSERFAYDAGRYGGSWDGSASPQGSPQNSGQRRKQPSDGLPGVQVSTEERNEILRAVQEGDDSNEEKTWSRRFVENTLSKVNLLN